MKQFKILALMFVAFCFSFVSFSAPIFTDVGNVESLKINTKTEKVEMNFVVDSNTLHENESLFGVNSNQKQFELHDIPTE